MLLLTLSASLPVTYQVSSNPDLRFTNHPAMKIVSIAVNQADLPLVDGDYCWADGKSVSMYDSTVVAITTDTGLTGYSEVVPLGLTMLTV